MSGLLFWRDGDETEYRVTCERRRTETREKRLVTLEGGIEKKLWWDGREYFAEPWEDDSFVHVNRNKIIMVEEVLQQKREYWKAKSKTFDDAARAIDAYEGRKSLANRRNVEIEVIDNE